MLNLSNEEASPMIQQHENILYSICDLLSVTRSQIESASRRRDIVYARMLYSHYAYQVTPHVPTIADSIKKPPYSIMRSLQKFDSELKHNKTFKYLKTKCDDKIQFDIRG